MFGFTKLLGAPPKAYRYYRATKDKDEKDILEGLHKAYDSFIKKEEFEVNSSIGRDADRKYLDSLILSRSFERLHEYANNRGM